MEKFLKFMKTAAFPIGVIPWALIYGLVIRATGNEPNTAIMIALNAFQITGMLFVVGQAIQSYLGYRKLKSRISAAREARKNNEF